MKLYNLLALLSSSFPVSLRIYLPLLSFLLKKIEAFTPDIDSTIASFAKFCFIRIIRHFEGKARVQKPGVNEICCIQNLEQLTIKVLLPHHLSPSRSSPSSGIQCLLESYTTVGEVLTYVLEKMEIVVKSCYYGLYLFVDKNGEMEQHLLDEDDNIMDVINHCENDREDFLQRVTTPKKPGFNSLWYYDYHIVIQLKIFYKLNPNDMEGHIFYFSQLASLLFLSLTPLPSLSILVKLISLSILIKFGSYEEGKEENLQGKINLEDFLPKNFKPSEGTSHDFLEKAIEGYIGLGGVGKEEAVKMFVDTLRGEEIFCIHQFSIDYTKINENSESPKINAILVVCPEGIKIFEKKNGKKIIQLNYKEILKWGLGKGKTSLLLVGEGGEQYFCEGGECRVINYCMNAYVNLTLGRGIDFENDRKG